LPSASKNRANDPLPIYIDEAKPGRCMLQRMRDGHTASASYSTVPPTPAPQTSELTISGLGPVTAIKLTPASSSPSKKKIHLSESN
jgi:hypothetical protein